jgi:hypothetical protein
MVASGPVFIVQLADIYLGGLTYLGDLSTLNTP